jgi:di-heme cytochrome c peroxidase
MSFASRGAPVSRLRFLLHPACWTTWLLLSAGAILGASPATAQLVPLSELPVPRPSNLAEFVRDERAAEMLGKALFRDMQVGSDEIQACATCHFRAGADSRTKNQGGATNPILTRDGTPIGGLAVLNFNTAPDADSVKADLVDLLKALTDERVLIAAAGGTGRDSIIEIPGTGRYGGPALPGFLEGPGPSPGGGRGDTPRR